MNPIGLMCWFRNGALPPAGPPSRIMFGGTALITEFADEVQRLAQGGRLSIAVPFIERTAVRQLLAPIAHSAVRPQHITLVTARKEGADLFIDEAAAMGWSDVCASLYLGLHAKIYCYVSQSGAGVCLIGSHNLTNAAFGHNAEAGTMITSGREPELIRITGECYDAVMAMAEKGSQVSRNF